MYLEKYIIYVITPSGKKNETYFYIVMYII